MFTAPEHSFFLLFNFPIYYYGIILAIAIFVGVVVSNRIAMTKYFLYNIVPNIATSVIIGGIIGARLYYCLLNYGYYLYHPIKILAIREGGLSIHGALLGGFIALYFEAKRNNIELSKLCDIISVSLPLSQAIGRWGNFFNSEAFGLPTALPWKLYIKQEFRPEKYISFEYFHPAFLYESILNIIIFFILYKFILPKYQEKSGITTAFYIILYSTVRLVIESIRTDCVKYMLGIPFPQLVSIVLIIGSIIFIKKRTSTNS